MNCVYIEDLIINDPSQLAILSLIYDKVSLPHPYDHDPNCEEIMRISFENERYRAKERKNYLGWKSRNKELFDGGVLSVLPAPISVAELPSDLDTRLRGQLSPDRLRLSTEDLLYGRIAVAMHAIFSKSNESEFKMAASTLEFKAPSPNDTSTPVLSRNVARAAIEWRAPMLPRLQPEQILELREKTAKFREGFMLYLDSIADEVAGRMSLPDRDNRRAAQEQFERKIKPDVAEFIRKELPDQIAWWGSIVKDLGKTGTQVMKTTVHPFDLSNYSEIAVSIGNLVEKAAQKISKGRSNQRHAQQFLARIATRSV